MKPVVIGLGLGVFLLACSQKPEQRVLFSTSDIFSLQGGVTTVYDWSEGRKGKVLRQEEGAGGTGTFTSDRSEFSGPFLVEITDAQLQDPMTGLPIRFEEEDQWSAVVPKNGSEELRFQINPFTTLARTYAETLVGSQGLAANAAVLRANQAVGDHFGGVNLHSTTPIDPRSVVGAVDKGAFYGLALYGFPLLAERLRLDSGTSPASFTIRELLRGLVKDLSDGVLNGKTGNDRVIVNGVSFEPVVFSLLYADVIRGFMNDTQKNHSGLVVSDVAGLLDNLSLSNGELFQGTSSVDRLPPTVEIISPADGALLSGTVEVEVTATDPDGFVSTMAFFLGSQAIADDDPSAGRFHGYGNTTMLGDGAKTAEAVVKDIAGHETRKTIYVVTDNGLPAVTLDVDGQAAVQGQAVGGMLDLVADVSDAIGSHSISLSSTNATVNAALIDSDPDPLRVHVLLQTQTIFPGTQGLLPITVRGEDIAHNVVEESYVFAVHNEGPQVTFLSPPASKTVRGLFEMRATATSALGMTAITGDMVLEGEGLLVGLTNVSGDSELFRADIDSATYNDQAVRLRVYAVDHKGLLTQVERRIGFNNVVFDSVHTLNRPEFPWQSGVYPEFGLFDTNGDGWHEIWFGRPGTFQTTAMYTGYQPWDPNGFNMATGQWGETFAPYPNFLEPEWVGSYEPSRGCDVDGDGKSDGVWGASWYPEYGNNYNSGRIWIGYGPQAVNGIWTTTQLIESPVQETIFSFGDELHCFDVNADGFDDIISRGFVFYGPSFGESLDMRAYVWEEPDGWGEEAMWRELGDVDGDGFDDMLVYVAQNRVRLLYGPLEPGQPILWGAEHAIANVTYAGNEALFNLGDLNGDGFADYGHSLQTTTGTDYGKFRVVWGSSVRAPNPVTWTIEDADPQVDYTSPAVGADFNGDGYSDIAIHTLNHAEDPNHTNAVTILYGPSLSIRQTIPVPQWGDFGDRLAAGDLLHLGRSGLIVGAGVCALSWPCRGDYYVYLDHQPNL